MQLDPLAIRELRNVIKAEIEELQAKVFTSLPASWEEFQGRVGRYKALNSLDKKLEQAAKKREEMDD